MDASLVVPSIKYMFYKFFFFFFFSIVTSSSTKQATEQKVTARALGLSDFLSKTGVCLQGKELSALESPVLCVYLELR